MFCKGVTKFKIEKLKGQGVLVTRTITIEPVGESQRTWVLEKNPLELQRSCLVGVARNAFHP